MNRLTMDFETRSTCDLKSAGAYLYSLHPSTIPTCFTFKIHGEKKLYFHDKKAINERYKWQTHGALWLKLIMDGYEFSAHNAFFEWCVYNNILVKKYGWPKIPDHQWRCTAAKAAACALPRNLEGAGAALGLSIQKDKAGYAAMMATCRPTRQWNAWNKVGLDIGAGKKVSPKRKALLMMGEPTLFLEPHHRPDVWRTLYRYNQIDVLAEEALDQALPDLNPKEQEIWFLNQKLNRRGLRVDIPTVEKIVGIMKIEEKRKLKELDHLTLGLVQKPGARKSILEFLALEGVVLPNIQAKTVEDVLKTGQLSEDMTTLLQLRQALSKTSTKKYQAFLNRAGDDHRVRDILLYHGASTGRDSGTGVQPHNFPRGVIAVSKDKPYAAVENVIELDAETLKLFYGDNLALVFSSILRNMLIPSKGHDLYVSDFSKIEVAVLWWLAGNEAGLEVLRSGKDPYIYQASKNMDKSYEEIERAVNAEEKWALDARQLGKAQILGCGFGMGATKFKTTAWEMYRLTLTETQSKEAVGNYREANSEVPSLWKNYERAAVMAIEKRKLYKVGKCKFWVENRFLWVELPSGRRLAYREPKLTMRQTEWGEQQTIEFMAVNSKTKKWGPERTWGGTLTENIVQAVARDLMMWATLRLEAKGYRALLMVHDEGLCEKEIGMGSVKEFTSIMCELPPWADKSLPLDAKGWKGKRYKK